MGGRIGKAGWVDVGEGGEWAGSGWGGAGDRGFEGCKISNCVQDRNEIATEAENEICFIHTVGMSLIDFEDYRGFCLAVIVPVDGCDTGRKILIVGIIGIAADEQTFGAANGLLNFDNSDDVVWIAIVSESDFVVELEIVGCDQVQGCWANRKNGFRILIFG